MISLRFIHVVTFINGRCCCPVTQSCLTLQPRGLQHAGLPCPSLSPRGRSNSCPLNTMAIFSSLLLYICFPGGSEVKVSACNAGDLGSIPGLERSPGEGNGNLHQYSCLENPMDRGTWQATVHVVTRVRHDLVTKPPPPWTD